MREKLLTMFASFSIKFASLCLRQVYGVFSLIYSQHLTILGSCYCKKPMDVSFLRVCPLIDDKLRHNTDCHVETKEFRWTQYTSSGVFKDAVFASLTSFAAIILDTLNLPILHGYSINIASSSVDNMIIPIVNTTISSWPFVATTAN